MKKYILSMVVSVLVACISLAQSSDELYLSGVSALIQHDYANAVVSLTRALDTGGSADRILMKRGQASYYIGNVDLAILDFKGVNDVFPDIADLWLARCYAKLGDAENAMYWLEKHLGSEFREPGEVIKKDPVFDELQLTEDWFLLWQQEWYGPEEEILQEARYYLNEGLPGNALNSLEMALAKGISGPEILSMRGRVNMELNNFGLAVSDYTSAIALDKTNAEYYLNRGYANFAASRYKDAVTDFSVVIRIEPELFDVYLARAEALAGQQLYNQAISDVMTYLEYFESDQHAIYLCGEYHFQKGDYLKALEYFNVNMKSDPYNAIYFKARGKTYTMTHTYKYAVYDLTMSLDLDPEDGETWLFLGITKMGTGDMEAACSDFEQARRLGEARALEYIINNCR